MLKSEEYSEEEKIVTLKEVKLFPLVKFLSRVQLQNKNGHCIHQGVQYLVYSLGSRFNLSSKKAVKAERLRILEIFL